MKSKIVLIVFAVLVIMIVIFLKMFIFNVYESELVVDPKKENYSVGEKVTISIKELNGFGKTIPFAESSPFKLSIIAGEDLVEIDHLGNKKIISLKKDGIVKLSVTSKNSLMPIYKEIKIN